MSLDDDVRAELRELEAVHRLRTPRVVDGMQGPRVVLDGVEVTSFASNDYLSLAGDRRLARAAASAVDEDGTGAGASRLIVGNHRRHMALEASIADWLCVDGARLFNSGFAANVGVLTSLLGPDDVVFSDELNHASIIDGCRLSRARVVVYPHCDVAALERALSSDGVASARRRIVVSETLFSMDGDIADVAALAALARRHEAALILDEAHAIGARGPEGRGVAAEANVSPDVLVGTCGKALGSFGAFAATSRAVADLLWNRARPLVFSTGLPPMICAAVQAALEIVRGAEGQERRQDLAAVARELRRLVPTLGGYPDSAIAPLLIGDDRVAVQLTEHLLERRLYVQGIRPPTVPEGTARLRISLAGGHTNQDVVHLASALRDAPRQFPVKRSP
ncbi:MAG TPA: 8-amino-7-oxononanoate synthase [Kofleriaceae bacterium]|nr:8-amino-7-oxononanoate synthase [Kofleriaceae bacterium]